MILIQIILAWSTLKTSQAVIWAPDKHVWSMFFIGWQQHKKITKLTPFGKVKFTIYHYLKRIYMLLQILFTYKSGSKAFKFIKIADNSRICIGQLQNWPFWMILPRLRSASLTVLMMQRCTWYTFARPTDKKQTC